MYHGPQLVPGNSDFVQSTALIVLLVLGIPTSTSTSTSTSSATGKQLPSGCTISIISTRSCNAWITIVGGGGKSTFCVKLLFSGQEIFRHGSRQLHSSRGLNAGVQNCKSSKLKFTGAVQRNRYFGVPLSGQYRPVSAVV
eukprot:169035-Rhodomonas_salina.2